LFSGAFIHNCVFNINTASSVPPNIPQWILHSLYFVFLTLLLSTCCNMLPILTLLHLLW
jgi:hypothetical protein